MTEADSAGAAEAPPHEPKFELTTSRQFPKFLAVHKLDVAFTTCQAGTVFLVGSSGINHPNLSPFPPNTCA